MARGVVALEGFSVGWVLCAVAFALASALLWRGRLFALFPGPKRAFMLDVLITVLLLLGFVLLLPDRTSLPLTLGCVLFSLIGLRASSEGFAEPWAAYVLELLASALVALAGLRISYVYVAGSGYAYFSYPESLAFGALWCFAMVRVFHGLDRVPGMAGSMGLATTFMTLVLAFLQGQSLYEAKAVGLWCALVFVLFWHRLLGLHVSLGESLSRTVGFLVAFSSAVGVSKGALLFFLLVPLAMLAVPIVEVSYSFVSSLVLGSGELSPSAVYRTLMRKGFSHGEALAFFLALTVYSGMGALLLYFAGGAALPSVALGGLALAFAYRRLRKGYMARRFMGGDLLGVPFDGITLDGAAARVAGWIEGKDSPRYVVTPDSLAVLRYREDGLYRDAVAGASMVLPDGTGVLLASRLLGLHFPERVSGIDLVLKLLEMGSRRGWRFYLLGGEEGVAEAASERISRLYPGVEVVGFRHGYFGPSEEEEVARSVRESSPDVVLVAMGVPRQEIWMRRWVPFLGPVVAIGVGGTLDVLSGRLRRAPRWMIALGLEWLYRLLQEPWRIRRVAKLPLFVLLVFWSFLSRLWTED